LPLPLVRTNTFTKSEPASHAVISSVGVNAPAIINFPSIPASLTTSRFSPGLTRNCAPASRHFLAASTLRTVPAPIKTSPELLFVSSRITSTAPGTVMVISTIGIPAWQTASAANRASRADDARTTGTTPILRILSRTLCLSIFAPSRQTVCFPSTSTSIIPSSRDAGSHSLHHLHHLLERHHRGVPWSRHRQSPVRRAALHTPLRLLSRQKPVDQT